jgi:hypothetical protein
MYNLDVIFNGTENQQIYVVSLYNVIAQCWSFGYTVTGTVRRGLSIIPYSTLYEPNFCQPTYSRRLNQPRLKRIGIGPTVLPTFNAGSYSTVVS